MESCVALAGMLETRSRTEVRAELDQAGRGWGLLVTLGFISLFKRLERLPGGRGASGLTVAPKGTLGSGQKVVKVQIWAQLQEELSNSEGGTEIGRARLPRGSCGQVGSGRCRQLLPLRTAPWAPSSPCNSEISLPTYFSLISLRLSQNTSVNTFCNVWQSPKGLSTMENP